MHVEEVDLECLEIDLLDKHRFSNKYLLLNPCIEWEIYNSIKNKVKY